MTSHHFKGNDVKRIQAGRGLSVCGNIITVSIFNHAVTYNHAGLLYVRRSHMNSYVIICTSVHPSQSLGSEPECRRISRTWLVSWIDGVSLKTSAKKAIVAYGLYRNVIYAHTRIWIIWIWIILSYTSYIKKVKIGEYFSMLWTRSVATTTTLNSWAIYECMSTLKISHWSASK